MLTMSGEWVANRQSRRWNIDPIPTRCMAMVKRTLATPVDQRVNYNQLLLGVPSTLDPTYASLGITSTFVNTDPTIVPGLYYAQLAKVVNGVEVAWGQIFGPFPVNVSPLGTQWTISTIQAVLPGDGLEDGWNLYFGGTAAQLTQKVSIPNNVTTFLLQTAGVPVTGSTGNVSLLYMQPGVYDDIGGGYVAKYRPAYTQEPPNQAWPAGGRYLRFSAVSGRALGAGNMTITPITDDPNYQPDVKVESLDEGKAQAPGSAPITNFERALKGDSCFLTCEYSNGGVPGAWFQLLEHISWYKPLRPTK